MASIDLNTSRPSAYKGQHLIKTELVYGCRIDPDSTDTIVVGAPVKLIDNTTEAIEVDLADGVTDEVFGFVVHEQRDSTFESGDYIKVIRNGNVMLMEASAAFNVGTLLQITPTGIKVATRTSTNTVIGIALSKATADGDFVRVLVNGL